MEINEISDEPANLWVVELFSMCVGDPPLSDGGIKGLSYLLIELADDVEEVRNLIEDNGKKTQGVSHVTI